MHLLSRRAALLTMAGALATLAVQRARAESRPKMTLYKSASCVCCQKWADHVTAAGFPVETVTPAHMDAVKARLGVPVNLRSCHTAEVAGYVIEGHVPVAALQRLLDERPQAVGLAVPGMPAGSPGMEGGEPEVFDVVIFTHETRRVFGRFKGATELSRS